jgi:hypothetical protein
MFEFLLLYALALLLNIRLVWKRLKVTNALAYYGTELITAIKCFIVQATGLTWPVSISLSLKFIVFEMFIKLSNPS